MTASDAIAAAVQAERDRLADALLRPTQDAADRIGHLSITCCPLSIGDRGRALLAGVAQMIGLTDPRDPPEGAAHLGNELRDDDPPVYVVTWTSIEENGHQSSWREKVYEGPCLATARRIRRETAALGWRNVQLLVR